MFLIKIIIITYSNTVRRRGGWTRHSRRFTSRIWRSITVSRIFASLFLVFGPFLSSLSRPNGVSARREVFTDAWKYFDAFNKLCFSGAPPRDRPRDRAKDDHAPIDHAIHDRYISFHGLLRLVGRFPMSCSSSLKLTFSGNAFASWKF